jgi:pyruvate formate lyase activating enzyme
MIIMDVPIKGFQKISMIDYPGKMCSVVFLADCNFRCPFCQNPDLILNVENLPDIDQGDIFEYLETRRIWIDGVCITGGEPTLHEGLPGFCRKLKNNGFLVKVDTNGTNPEMLEKLVKKKLVDYIAMDIKGPPERYAEISGVPVDIEKIKKSVEIIRNSGIDYEFRTTVLPRLIKERDLESIGEWLNGSKRYALQQFRSMVTLDKSYEKETSYSEERMKRFEEILKPYFETVEVRV